MITDQRSRAWPVVMVVVAGVWMLTSGEAWAWHHEDSRACRPSWSRSSWHEAWWQDRPHHRGHDSSPTIVFDFGWGRSYSEPVRYAQVIPAAPSDTVVINIVNANGSYTPVTLRRVGGVYVGPRGEQYLNVPTVEQLNTVYGLR